MKKNLLIGAILVAVMASVFGNGDAADGGDSQFMDEENEAKLILWVYDQGRIEILTEIGKDFENQYGVAVEVALVDLGQIRTQMVLASGADESADLAIIPHDNLGALVENDAVLPIDLGSKRSEYIDSAVDGFTYNGEVYGLPLAVENIGFFRNTDLVPDAPKTWNEMYNISKALIESGKTEVMMGLPDATYNIFPVYTSFGGYIFGRDSGGSLNARDIGMNKEGFVEGLEWLSSMVNEGLIPASPDWDGSQVLFETGKAPFLMTGPWSLNRINTSGVPYAISKFPSNGAPFIGVQGVVVSSVSNNAILAQTFLTEFLATEENMQRIFDAEQRPSAWKTVYESSNDSNIAGFNEAGVNGVPMPSIPAMGYVWDAWVNAAALAFSGELSSFDALNNAVDQINIQIKNAE